MDRISWPVSTNMVPTKVCLAMQFPEVGPKMGKSCVILNSSHVVLLLMISKHSTIERPFILTLICGTLFMNS